MIEEAYDLVIRVNPQPDESLVGRVFLRDRLVVVASPACRDPQAATPAGKLRVVAKPVLSLSSFIMVRDAVRAGVGAARLPLSLASSDLATGRLVSWGEVEGFQTVVWALYPTRRLLSARVAAFLEYLKAAFPQGTPKELAAYIEQ